MAIDPPRKKVHILIVGAGLTGLVLAQGLNKFNASPAAATFPVEYSYSIFERSREPLARGGGYSLTFHWSLPHLEDALPPEVLERLKECSCNPHADDIGQRGKFQFLNLRTAEPKISVPAMGQIRLARVSREKLIRLLMTGVEVQYSRQLTDITCPDADKVTAHFSDGSSETGNLILGTDGGSSTVRRLLCPGDTGKARILPVRQLALKATFPIDKARDEFQKIDPNIIMGGDPEKDMFFWFSFIDIPRPSSSQTTADAYITMSYPCEDREGKPLDVSQCPPVPESSEERLALMKRLGSEWADPMRTIVRDIADDTFVREIVVMEWLPKKGSWDTLGGRATMLGDAAHPMSSCRHHAVNVLLHSPLTMITHVVRGEAANHAVLDAGIMLNLLLKKEHPAPAASDMLTQTYDLGSIIDAYESEMEERARQGVTRSTRACIDANHWDVVGKDSFFAQPRRLD